MARYDFFGNEELQVLKDNREEKEIYGTAGALCLDIENKQLCDESLWARFVEEFRVRNDGKNGIWCGEYWGKMMRGAVLVYQYTKSPRLYSVLENTVRDIMSTADEHGRISTYPEEHEFFAWDLWCRKYVLLGLEFFIEICRDSELEKQIIASLSKQCDCLCSKIGDGKISIAATAAGSAWGGMNSASVLEPVVRLYRLTEDGKYLDFARHIVNSGACSRVNIFEAAYENKKAPYEYGINKAYEMISCFEGLLEYYYLTKDEKARATVEQFAEKVAETDVTVIGSCGCTHELFDASYLRQTADVSDTAIMQETCVTVTWMKFCEKMLRLTGKAKWADMTETSFYNAYLGAYNPKFLQARDVKKYCEDGRMKPSQLLFDSYSPLTVGTRGVKTGGLQKLADGGYFGCCASIAAAGAGLFANSRVLNGENGPYIAGFESWKYRFRTPAGQEAVLFINGSYPYSQGAVQVILELEKNEKFTINLRAPGWSKKTDAASENAEMSTGDGWISFEKEWSDGDKISLAFDMSLSVMHAPLYDSVTTYNIDWAKREMFGTLCTQTEREKRKICVSRGPVVLAEEEGLTSADISEPVSEDFILNAKIAAKSQPDLVHHLVCTLKAADGKTLTLCDYASAGSDWQKKICAWMDAE